MIDYNNYNRNRLINLPNNDKFQSMTAQDRLNANDIANQQALFKKTKPKYYSSAFAKELRELMQLEEYEAKTTRKRRSRMPLDLSAKRPTRQEISFDEFPFGKRVA